MHDKNRDVSRFENSKATEDDLAHRAMSVAAHYQQIGVMRAGGRHQHRARRDYNRRHKLDHGADAMPTKLTGKISQSVG